MRKVNLILTGILSCASFWAYAQISNNGFEIINAEGNISNWTNNTLLTIAIDSNGHADSVVVDNAFYFSTNDAHSGAKAMEMRNAYDFTNNIAYAGTAMVTDNDSAYAFFQSAIPVSVQPASFNFYYKYFPVNNEWAYGEMNVYDSMDNVIGNATFTTSGTTAVYTFASAPVIYTTFTTAAFISVKFSTCLSSQAAGFGTRFLVDDVGMNGVTNVYESNKDRMASLSCYPTLATEVVHLVFKGIDKAGTMNIVITDAGGKTVFTGLQQVNNETVATIDISTLAAGSYFIKATNEQYQLNSRFLK